MNYLYHCFYAKIGAEKIEQMTLPASDPITALTVFLQKQAAGGEINVPSIKR